MQNRIDHKKMLELERERILEELRALPNLHLKWIKGRPYVYSTRWENGQTVTKYWAPLFPEESKRQLPPNIRAILAEYHSTTAYKQVLKKRLKQIEKILKQGGKR